VAKHFEKLIERSVSFFYFMEANLQALVSGGPGRKIETF